MGILSHDKLNPLSTGGASFESNTAAEDRPVATMNVTSDDRSGARKEDLTVTWPTPSPRGICWAMTRGWLALGDVVALSTNKLLSSVPARMKPLVAANDVTE